MNNSKEIDSGPAVSFECPVTGLPVLRKPEWTDIAFGKDYKLTISIIGDRVVWLQPSGYATLDAIKEALEFTGRVRGEAIPENCQYVQIDDLKNIKGVTHGARKFLIKNTKNRKRLRGLIYYNVSPMLKIGIKLGKRFNFLKFDAESADNYSSAIKRAQELLATDKTIEVELPDKAASSNLKLHNLDKYKIITHPDWELKVENFSLRFEIIGGNILHAISTGRLKVQHIDQVFRLQEKVIRSMNVLSGSYYIVLGLKKFVGIGQRARKQYVKAILSLYEKYPFQMLIFYGANRMLAAAINLARPFVPFKVRIPKNLNKALKLTAENSPDHTSPTHRVPDQEPVNKTAMSDRTDQYVKELLQYLEQIDWEVDGINEKMRKNRSHPFSPVFDAIELLKWELDDLYQQRRQAEKALRKSEEKYRKIVEASPMGMHMYKLEPDGRLVFIGYNKAAGEILGVDNQLFMGKTIEEAFPPLAETEVPDRYRRACERGESWETEHIDYRDDQIQGAFEVHAFQTSPGKMATMFFDITARKQAEDALLQSRERYKTLTNNLHVGIYRNTLGPKGEFLEANSAIVEMFGYLSREEFLSVSIADLYQNADDRKKFNAKMLKQGIVRNEEILLRKKDGTPFVGSTSAVAVKNEKGEVKYYDGVIENITERKQLEMQLQQAQRMEAIGTLAGGIAHDFNNILAAIIANAELTMMDIPEGSQAVDNLNELIKASHRAKDLVKQILTVSRKGEKERKPILVNPIVKEAIKLLRASLPTTIQIQQRIDTSAIIVEADATQIHQVLMNLCTNAAHAMNDNGGILKVNLSRLNIHQKEAATYPGLISGPFLKLSVSDTGHGISSAELGRIFDPYYTTKEKGAGTGLGLAVVQGIVKTFGGAVTVDSEPGKGSTFHVYLPIIEREILEDVKHSDPFPTGDERILFVDDEYPLVKIGKMILERLGYEVVTRTSSVEALELFRRNPTRFDLVITDMTMPNMTGDQLAIALLDIRPDVPIILCTGYSEKITSDRTKDIGIKSFIMKPIVIRELSGVIRNVLDGN